ncbi:MAG: methyltransferase domain-containing protein [Chloroflexi bacterium]|nr:methyltransferase domain-containing protein [Chloroflexota bacterium]
MNILENEARIHSEFLHPGGLKTTQTMMKWLALKPEQRVLEIGCGTATTATLLAQQTGCRVNAVEQLPAMLQAARLRVHKTQTQRQVSLTAANASHPLPFKQSSFHAAYAESVVALLDAGAVMREITRVLRPGGKFFLNDRVWKSDTPKQVAAEVNEKSRQHFGILAATLVPFDRDDWVDALRWAGFTNVRAIRVSTLLGMQPQRKGQYLLNALLRRLKRARQYLLRPQTAIHALRFQLSSQQHRHLWGQLESYLFFAEKPS